MATRDAGGSHGGRGQGWHSGAGGETYDSVYLPDASGAGGSWGGDTSGDTIPGRRGGGVLVIEAGSVQLDGSLKAISDIGFKFADASGAGGTVRIHTGTLSGTGVIDASAERTDEGGCAGGTTLGEGSGGGGRVALWVDTFDGFDPETQATVRGGRHYTCGGLLGYSPPGTVFFKTPDQEYGTLLVDGGGTDVDSDPDKTMPTTELPVLGAGQVTAHELDGDDAWVTILDGQTGATELLLRWHGAFMRLWDAQGEELGVFRVSELDAQGRGLLEGAATVVAGATTYKGLYRFDDVLLRGEAGLTAADPIEGPELVIESDAELSGVVEATAMTIKSGATVTPAAGDRLHLKITDSPGGGSRREHRRQPPGLPQRLSPTHGR